LMIAVSYAFDLLVQITDPDSKSDAELNAYCSWSMWMLNIGYLTMSTILFCKLYRVHKITKFRRNQAVHPYHLIGPFIFVLLLGIGALTAKEVLYPLQYGKFSDSDETFTAPSCGYQKSWAGLLLWVVQDSIVIGICFFAYRLRHVSEEIGDSRKIFFIYCFCLPINTMYRIVAILIPDSSLEAKEKFTLIYVACRLTYFLQIMAFINILILPRMYYICYKKVYGILPENVRIYGTSQVRVNIGGPTTAATTTMRTLPPTTTITNIDQSITNQDAPEEEIVFDGNAEDTNQTNYQPKYQTH